MLANYYSYCYSLHTFFVGLERWMIDPWKIEKKLPITTLTNAKILIYTK